MPAEQPAPGQAAYEVMYLASGVDVRWEDLDGDDQRLWDDIAAVVAGSLRAENGRLQAELAEVRADLSHTMAVDDAEVRRLTAEKSHLEARVTALTQALEREAKRYAG